MLLLKLSGRLPAIIQRHNGYGKWGMRRSAARSWRTADLAALGLLADTGVGGPRAPAPRVAAAARSIGNGGGNPRRIMGLDPGSRRTGYSILESSAAGVRHVASGCIDVAGNELPVRLSRIYSAVHALVVEHIPTEVAIERVFVHRNPDSALKLGQARGAALCAAVSAGASTYEYAPRAIKLAVTGYGGAEKQQVARMVMALLHLESRPQADAADALAIALCHAHARRLELLAS